jgi:hypothetical protein
MPSPWIRVQLLVVLVLAVSYACFWHLRDWNTASRLMLTYAMVDRGTVCLDGLNDHTGDIAFVRGHYYCDKLPGFSLWATLPYAFCRTILRLPPHPLYVEAEGFPPWTADYLVTLASSGLFTILTAMLLLHLARWLGCTPRRAALVALAYGLATPAYVYATLAYGHQLSAFALFASFYLLCRPAPQQARVRARLVAAGFLAAYAAVVELQVGPVSAILGLTLLVQCLARRRRPDALAYFGLGAIVPTLVLLLYNTLAFGSPFDMGYFHHATAEFARVHNRQNPLGLQLPDPRLIAPLLWGEYRGLFFYAPVLLLALPGWVVLARRRTELAVVSLACCLAVFVVNLSYPEWTGGWSTGPRLLIPLLPFGMVPVAALLAVRGRSSRTWLWLALLFALAGGVLMLLFQGAGGRVPQYIEDPLREFVWTCWRGPRLWARYLPLVAAQLLAIAVIVWTGRPVASNLGIDQEEHRRRADQDAQDPEAEPQGVHPDARP